MSTYNYLSNYRRFAELLVYTLSKFESVNETKFLKLLYFADAKKYEKTQKTISENVTYWKNLYGPTPHAKVLMNIYDELGGFIKREEKHNNGNKSCILKLQSTDFRFKNLTTEDFDLIDETFNQYGMLTVMEIVKLSHLDPPYLASEKKNKIDFKYVVHRRNDESEYHLPEQLRQHIASEISESAMQRLKSYAEARP